MSSCRADPAAAGTHARIRAWLELTRPANVLTAVTDGLTGFAISGLENWQGLPWLLAATSGLYAGGVVLNDFFDRATDAQERPERPIPSGRVSPAAAACLGAGCLGLGVLAAFRVNPTAGMLAAAIAVSVLAYDAWGKHYALLGPANMGLCRGLNLMLGMAAAPESLSGHWWLGGLSFLYICGVTALSRGEVHGGKRPVAIFSLTAIGTVLAGVGAVAVLSGEHTIWALALAAVLGWRVIPPFYEAVRQPESRIIRNAVRTGVLSLGILDAALAAAYAGPLYGTLVVAVSLLALGLARLFAVT
jgi:4-hydroxybenzoate polyprenyltransferase